MALIAKVELFSITTFSDDLTDTIRVHERLFHHPGDAVEYVVEPFLTDFYADSHPDDTEHKGLRSWLVDTMVFEPSRLSAFENAKVEALGFTWLITKHTVYMKQTQIEVTLEVDEDD